MNWELNRNKDLVERIKRLGDKSTQLLLFLSFAFLAVITMRSEPAISAGQRQMLTYAMQWWERALWPILFGVLPVRDFADYAKRKTLWYEIIRWSKVVLLIVAVVLILLGVTHFAQAIVVISG